MATRNVEPGNQYLEPWANLAQAAEDSRDRIRQAAADAIAALSDLPTGEYGVSVTVTERLSDLPTGPYPPVRPTTSTPTTPPINRTTTGRDVIENHITLMLDNTPVVQDFILEGVSNRVRQNRQRSPF